MHRLIATCLTLLASAALAGGCASTTASGTSGGSGGSGATTGTGGSGAEGGSGGSGGQACTPSDEVCDGVDNDCDGEVDETCACIPGATEACYSGPVGTQGVGPCQGGTHTCDATGQWGACTGEVLPADEACNTFDDDCNGTADDMGVLTCGVGGCMAQVPACLNGVPGSCVPGQPAAEICNGIDDDCDQLTDETFPNEGVACVTGMPGACSAGTLECVNNNGVTAPSCVQAVMPVNETCDGVDNDCNGMVDDNIPGTGGACSTGLLGPCGPGTISCQNSMIDCFPDVPPSAEVCDGIDNDCNGTVDDPPGANQPCNTGLLGVCALGLQVCATCVQQQMAAATDTCGDNLDNDCDGQVDEGCLYTFSGVQTNLPIANLTGWTQCYLDGYGSSGTALSTILTQCNKAKLLLGCRTTGSATLSVAANAPRLEVTFDTGTTQTPHNANNVGWYYNSSYSWGFAPQGSPINRNSCDIVDSQTYPGGGASDGAQRLCWHTSNSALSSGWRCGKPDFLGVGYERIVFHAD